MYVDRVARDGQEVTAWNAQITNVHVSALHGRCDTRRNAQAVTGGQEAGGSNPLSPTTTVLFRRVNAPPWPEAVTRRCM